jgi:hypothetical protein
MREKKGERYVGETNALMKIEIMNNRELQYIFLASYHYEIFVL